MLMIGTRESGQQHRKAGQLFSGTPYFLNDFLSPLSAMFARRSAI